MDLSKCSKHSLCQLLSLQASPPPFHPILTPARFPFVPSPACSPQALDERGVCQPSPPCSPLSSVVIAKGRGGTLRLCE